MFTLEQIEELHRRLGNAETLSDYVRSLAALGVARYDSFVSDGHSEYLGRNAFLDHLRRHEQGETSYLRMSKGLADSGSSGGPWTPTR